MPTLKKYCPICADFVATPHTHAAPKSEQNRMYDKLYRDNQSAKFYHSKQWQDMRKAVLADEPFCRICGRPAKIVDHIQPIRQGGATLDIANLQPLCHACHNAKTNKENHACHNAKTNKESK